MAILLVWTKRFFFCYLNVGGEIQVPREIHMSDLLTAYHITEELTQVYW